MRTEGECKKEKSTSFESRQRSTVEALESEMSKTLKHKTETNGERSKIELSSPSGVTTKRMKERQRKKKDSERTTEENKKEKEKND